ncbi:resistance to inhibitors of cholinesterase protein 3-like [Branchiostoma floridae]|uniref:Resistance to inhibitors of cholinesterase protein 3-like n=1 Tax=Branchiostoma floridae TaxID=7739 RepID=A0A9J7L3H7_BRAFL|nr:resistance to inhibitors of cholinesterase protein 3-like [Branchiostoma floridae]
MKGLDNRARNKYAYAPEHVQSMPPFSVLLVGALLVILIAVGLPWLYSSRYPDSLKSKAADNIRARNARNEPSVHTHVVRDGRPGPFPGAAAQRVTRQPAPKGARSIMATVLPIYGIGIGAYVLFTMYKVFGGKAQENDPSSSTKNYNSVNERVRRRQDNSCNKRGFSLFGQRKRKQKGRFNQEDLMKLKEKIAETEQLMQKALADMAATVENVAAEELKGQFDSTQGGGEGADTKSSSEQVQNKTADTSSQSPSRAGRERRDEMGSDNSLSSARDVSQIKGELEEDSPEFDPATGETLATNKCDEEVKSGVSDDHDMEASSDAADNSTDKPDIACLDGKEIIDVEDLGSDSEGDAVLRHRNVDKSELDKSTSQGK